MAVYAIVNGNQAGWTSLQTLGLLAAAAGLAAVFLAIEFRVHSPLMPLGLFRKRNLATANIVGVLWAGTMFAWFLLSALYLQLVLGYDVLPSMLLLGFGAGIAFNPVLLAAMGDVDPHDSGLASGIVNTSFMMGGALGLAILASVAASRTSHLLAAGQGQLAALDAGYHTAFVIGTLFALLAALIAGVRLQAKPSPVREEAPRRQGEVAYAETSG